MSAYSIERGIPVPVAPSRPGAKATIFPFPELKVGESFLVPCKRGDGMADRVRNMARYHSRKLNRTFVHRRVRDGIRCWRTT